MLSGRSPQGFIYNFFFSIWKRQELTIQDSSTSPPGHGAWSHAPGARPQAPQDPAKLLLQHHRHLGRGGIYIII